MRDSRLVTASFDVSGQALCVEGHDVEEEREKQEAEERMSRLIADVAGIKQALASQSQLLRTLLAFHSPLPAGPSAEDASRPPSAAL